MSPVRLLGLFVGVACVACVPFGPGVQCLPGGAEGDVEVFAADVGPTEGLTFTKDGRLFVTSGDTVLELFADGTKRVHASVPKTVGIVAWGDALYVASGDDGSGGTGQFCAETRRGGVYRVGLDGTATLFASGIRAPNFLVVTPWDTLLVSDDCATNTKLYEVSKTGGVRTFHDGIPSANGLVFSWSGDVLFSVSTFTDPAPFWKLPITGQVPGTQEKLHEFAGGTSPDGLAIDGAHRVYVALNTGSRIERWDPSTSVMEPFATGLETPASLAFGVGSGFDPCSLYVTSLFGQDVSRVRVGPGSLALRD